MSTGRLSRGHVHYFCPIISYSQPSVQLRDSSPVVACLLCVPITEKGGFQVCKKPPPEAPALRFNDRIRWWTKGLRWRRTPFPQYGVENPRLLPRRESCHRPPSNCLKCDSGTSRPHGTPSEQAPETLPHLTQGSWVEYEASHNCDR